MRVRRKSGLGCDLVVSASPDALGRAGRERTTAIVNAQETVTGDFTRNADWDFPAAKLQGMIRDVVGRAVDFPDATRLATALMGDAIATNPFMLGFAWQRGLIPLSSEAILRAVELNGVAVAFNKRAFQWGRRAAIDLAAVERIATPVAATIPQTLPEIVDMHFPAPGIFHNIVIISIDKRYPGHARKIMNAVWGLGQLMFSKCVVIVDKDVNVQDPAEVAWVVGTHVDPIRDVVITQGPVDDLDDASLLPAYGGKMGVDATRKWPAEGFTREWPKRLKMSDAPEQKAAAILKKLKL